MVRKAIRTREKRAASRLRPAAQVSPIALACLMALACEPQSPLVGETGPEQGQGQGGSGPTARGTYTAFALEHLDETSSCLPRALPTAADGSASCILVRVAEEATCTCDRAGRSPVTDALARAAREQLARIGYCEEGVDCESLCACAADPVADADREACRTELDAEVDGWCYVDAEAGGNPDLTSCPKDRTARTLRILGSALPRANEKIALLACGGGNEVTPPNPSSEVGALGDQCLLGDEWNPSFSGTDEDEVVIEETKRCETGICLRNHFRGLVNCPYGQTPEAIASGEPQCFVPGTNVPVQHPVRQQLASRPPDIGSICSCRCDGPGPGPYCTCADDMECAHLLDALGFPTDAQYAGSYCIPRGSAFDDGAIAGPSCSTPEANCGDPRPYPPQ